MLIIKTKLLIKIYQIRGPGCEIVLSASATVAALHDFPMYGRAGLGWAAWTKS